jgi:type IV secretory pathway VirB4 component
MSDNMNQVALHISEANIWPWVAAITAALVVLAVLLEVNAGVKQLSLRRRRSRYKYGHASALLYSRHVRPNIIKLSNGAFLAMYEMAAPDASVFDANGLAASDFGIARAVSQFNEHMVVHMHQRNIAYREYDGRETPYAHPVLEWLDKRRHSSFTSGRCFRSRRIVSIAWEPPKHRDERLRAATSAGADSSVRNEDELIADFEVQLQQIEAFFRTHGLVRRLSVVKQADVFGISRERSEMLEHLAWCISGKEIHINVPIPGQELNGLLGETFRGGYDLKVGDSETQVIVLKALPDSTYPLMFSRLAELRIDFALVVRWMPLSGPEAKKLLKGAYAEWTTKSNESLNNMKDPHAIDMIESARQALGFLSSGGKMGVVNVYVILRAPDKKRVKDAAQKTVALLDEIGYKAFIATLTAEDDYFAQLPGDGYHGVRKYPLSAVNVAHLFSFHEESSGRRLADSPTLPRRQPCLTYAIAGFGETMYHVNLNDEPRDLFHHFGVGGTGSGKSVTLAHIAAMWVARMPIAGFTGIDRGRSLYRLCNFLDGNFYDVLGDQNPPGFALFSEIDEPQIRRELLDIIEGFVELQGDGRTSMMTPQRRRSLEVAMDSMLQIPPNLRSLRTYYELLQDPEGILRPALLTYTRDGSLGRTLDTETDSFSTGMFNVVEIGRIFNMQPKFLIPVMQVMFWKARTQVRRLKERTGNYDIHWLFQIDEAHTLLNHKLGQKFIQDELKMGRKEKRALGLWSNAASDYAKSEIKNDILEACKTRFFFRNLDVLDDEGVRAMYAELGLPRRGIEWLPDIQLYSMLLHQPASRELQEIRWNFDRAWLAIIGRGRDSDNRRLDDFKERFPHSWREELLRFEGVDEKLISELLALLEATRRLHQESGLTYASSAAGQASNYAVI